MAVVDNLIKKLGLDDKGDKTPEESGVSDAAQGKDEVYDSNPNKLKPKMPAGGY